MKALIECLTVRRSVLLENILMKLLDSADLADMENISLKKESFSVTCVDLE